MPSTVVLNGNLERQHCITKVKMYEEHVTPKKRME